MPVKKKGEGGVQMEIQLVCPQPGSAVSISSAELGHSFQSASCKETSGLRNRNPTAP